MPKIIKPAKGTFTTADITIDGSGRVIAAQWCWWRWKLFSKITAQDLLQEILLHLPTRQNIMRLLKPEAEAEAEDLLMVTRNAERWSWWFWFIFR